MTWAHVFEPTQSEAAGYVTLSCFPGKYDGEAEGGQAALVATPSRDQATCYSKQQGDVQYPKCEEWCSPQSANDHCRWCKCRGCESMRTACADILHALEAEAAAATAFLSTCGRQLDCKSWCNAGNCVQCPCAACERCGHSALIAGQLQPSATTTSTAPPPSIRPMVSSRSQPTRNIVPASSSREAIACHGWCIEGAKDDPNAVCRSSKCLACSFCSGGA